MDQSPQRALGDALSREGVPPRQRRIHPSLCRVCLQIWIRLSSKNVLEIQKGSLFWGQEAWILAKPFDWRVLWSLSSQFAFLPHLLEYNMNKLNYIIRFVHCVVPSLPYKIIMTLPVINACSRTQDHYGVTVRRWPYDWTDQGVRGIPVKVLAVCIYIQGSSPNLSCFI